MLWLLCIVAGTLAPFNFVTRAALEHGPKMFQYGAFERDPIHFVLNLLLFMPFGVLLHHEERSRSTRLLRIVILAGIVGCTISATGALLRRRGRFLDQSGEPYWLDTGVTGCW